MPIKILFVDDHAVVRSGITNLLFGSDIEVVAVAEDGAEALKAFTKHAPDVVLLDVRMGEEDGMDILASLRKKNPVIPVVMFSAYDNPTYVARAIAGGAVDYILKGNSREAIADTIHRAARRDEPREKSLLTQIQRTMERRKDRHEHPDLPLTNRERQVLRHIALGLSNKEIAHSLEISVETVKEHVQNILRKLNSPDRTAAAVWAMKIGLVK